MDAESAEDKEQRDAAPTERQGIRQPRPELAIEIRYIGRLGGVCYAFEIGQIMKANDEQNRHCAQDIYSSEVRLLRVLHFVFTGDWVGKGASRRSGRFSRFFVFREFGLHRRRLEALKSGAPVHHAENDWPSVPE